jgi:hypothetical protein
MKPRASAAVVACLLLAACASTSPAPEPAEVSLAIPAPAIHEPPKCDEALIKRIVKVSMDMALFYPPHSAHRQVYIDQLEAWLDAMLFGMPQLPQGEWGRCVKMQTDAMQSYMLSREDSAGNPIR